MNSNQDTIFEWYDFQVRLETDKVISTTSGHLQQIPNELDIDLHSRYAKLAQMIDDDSRHAAIKNNYRRRYRIL